MNAEAYVHKVQFYETDQMGIVHHSNYIRWLEEARVDFMERIGYAYQKAASQCVDFAVLGVSCEYKSMLRFGDSAEIRMEITALTASRLTISYRLHNRESGLLCATAQTRHCFYHNSKQRPVSLKKELPGLYQLLERAVAVGPRHT